MNLKLTQSKYRKMSPLIYFAIFLFLKCSWQSLAYSLNVEPGFLLTPERLPDDLNFMPSLSNGHLGFTIFGDAIYTNGVYNGFKGDSRRARLPNWLNITGHILSPQTKSYLKYDRFHCTMDLYNGLYKWIEIYENVNITMEQRVYAHRYFNRALIYEIEVHREIANESITIELQQNPGPNTKAFTLKAENSERPNVKLIQATTVEVENETFQPNFTKIYVALNDDFPENRKSKTIAMTSGQKTLYYRFVLTVDLEKSAALKEFEDGMFCDLFAWDCPIFSEFSFQVLTLPKEHLLLEHTSLWQKFWSNFQIKLDGGEELMQIINAGIFYMANSLPSLETNQRNHPYFGLSPTGLGRGQLDDDYEGHNFWDTEIWMLPVVTQFEPFWSKELFKYRLEHLPGAIYNANITGYKGARFPWESAFTGTEVTNPCYPEVATQQVHISADIVLALQQFYATTFNRDWLCGTAWQLVREIAKFLQSRVTWQKQTQKFHILNVMGPDEDHENVDDNVFTNVVFKKAFEFARFTHLECDPAANESSLTWLNIANNMFVLYDTEKNYHPQHLGYRPGDKIKQADTILLGYPLQYPMKNSTRLNDLRMYENVTRDSGPAMTWSMFAINYLDIDLPTKSAKYFEQAYKNYIRPEFKVWSETKIGFKGSSNFLTGIGGFMQAILNGFAGIRFQLDNNTAKMFVKQTYLLPNTNKLNIKGIKFASASFELTIEKSKQNKLKLSKLGDQPLEIIIGSKTEPSELYEGFLIYFQTDSIIIQTRKNEDKK